MHPELELFLEEAFASAPATSPEIGRVVVEPDYNVAPEARDAGHLTSELLQCVAGAKADKSALAKPQGQQIEVPGSYRLLSKYIRQITLHADPVEGPWVEVSPPGNWI